MSSLTYPTIKYISASKTTSDVLFMALIENNGNRGVVKLKGFNKDSGNCVEVCSNNWCIEESYNDHITELYHLINTYKVITPFSIGCLLTYNCTGTEDCNTLSCSNFSSTPYSSNTNISVSNVLGISPNSVKNFTLIPRDKKITASWNEPDNTSIFAYVFYVKRASDNIYLVSGHVNRTSVLIDDLVNNVSYKVGVRAVSYDCYYSSTTELTATPVAPLCNNLSITTTVASS